MEFYQGSFLRPHVLQCWWWLFSHLFCLLEFDVRALPLTHRDCMFEWIWRLLRMILQGLFYFIVLETNWDVFTQVMFEQQTAVNALFFFGWAIPFLHTTYMVLDSPSQLFWSEAMHFITYCRFTLHANRRCIWSNASVAIFPGDGRAYYRIIMLWLVLTIAIITTNIDAYEPPTERAAFFKGWTLQAQLVTCSSRRDCTWNDDAVATVACEVGRENMGRLPQHQPTVVNAELKFELAWPPWHY